jgi:membrane-bound lytic murein transglycosylase D
MWQFTPDTARRYNLHVSGIRDERRDPIRATQAAALYLRDLYGLFNDWYLAIAAYNAGEGRIIQALTRTGLTNFWELRRAGALPKITSAYVPHFIALTLVLKNPELYGADLGKVSSSTIG